VVGPLPASAETENALVGRVGEVEGEVVEDN
jgi:hypothetical protein